MPEQSTTINPGQSLGRAFDNFVFYFELSESHHPILYPISKLLPRYGARMATFLDNSVTHYVFDKAKTLLETHNNASKWLKQSWNLTEFIQHFTRILHVNNDQNLAPFLKLARARARDLNQCLEEEKRDHRVKPSRIAPFCILGSGKTAANQAAAGRITTAVKPATSPKSAQQTPKKFYQPFEHPFVKIEDSGRICLPVYKQYPPNEAGRVTFSVLRTDTMAYNCPFSYNSRPRDTNAYWSEMKTDVSEIDFYRAEHEASSEATLPASPVKLSEERRLNNTQIVLGGDPSKRPALVQKPKPGYCELCFEKFDNLREHAAVEKHRTLAMESDRYARLDVLLSECRRPIIQDFNPILAWAASRNVINACVIAQMSPAQSTVRSLSKRRPSKSSNRSGFLPTPLLPTFEEKENDAPPFGLDLTGIDKDYIAQQKRRVLSNDSSDVFQPEPPKRKMRRASQLAKCDF